MDASHYLNFRKLDLTAPVYRYIQLIRLFELFETSENLLVHPSKWEDPFENFILNSVVPFDDGTFRRPRFRDRVVGQCWTVESRSDAMWRLYSTKGALDQFEGVRIRTTLGKLGASLTDALGGVEAGHAFVGEVRYMRDAELFREAAAIFGGDLGPAQVAESLLIKRTAFKHEREIRLVFTPADQPPRGAFPYEINPHDLVDQILIDPRVPPTAVEARKQFIRERTGFRGELKWSLLYSPPKFGLSQLPHVLFDS